LRRLQRKIIYGEKSHLRDPLGQRKIIENATREQLLRIKNEVFVPKNSALLVAGDFKTDELRKLMDKHFLGWKNPKNWKSPADNQFPEFPNTTEVVMFDKLARTPSLSYAFKGPRARLEPKDSFAADMLISLLNVRSGKFYKKYIDSGLAINAGLGYYTQSQAGEVNIYGSCQPEKVK